MQFNDKDAAAFWPVYKMYEAEESQTMNACSWSKATLIIGPH
jgi:hypothetical protein